MRFVSARPSKRLVVSISVLLLLSATTAFVSEMPTELGFLPLVLAVALLFGVLADFLLSKSPPLIGFARKLPDILSLYQQTQIDVAIANNDKQILQFEWLEKLPDSWRCTTQTNLVALGVNETQYYSYNITPERRGEYSIEGVYVRLFSYFKLLEITWFVESKSTHKVFPNFAAITDLTGLNGSINLQQSGLKKFNLRGTGMDFLQLRDYREGESLRQIDWRATSRFNRLISKEFQEEKNQHVVIMLDAGRRMRVQDEQLSYFEHALNALILLSFTALKNGDNLSVQSFGTQSRWLRHVKGAQNVSRVLQHFYDLYPQKIASDYLTAAQELITKQSKRSLVLLVSCLRDEDFEDLLTATTLLQEKHLVAVISIQEPIYAELQNRPINDFEGALNVASSHVIQRSIEHNLAQLRHKGVLCIQCGASELTASLINSYLSIKKAGLL